MKTNNTEALGTAPVGPLLLKLSIPAMAGMFMLSLYNVVDAFFVGRGVGALGIAIVASTSWCTLRVGASVFLAISTAGQIISSQLIDQFGFFGMPVQKFNVKQIPDQKVRQAIFYALNTKDIDDAVFLSDEYYDIPTSFLPPTSEFYTDNVEKYDQDIEKAKALLKEAGAEGLKVELTYSGSDAAQATQAAMIQEQLAAVGITCSLNGMDSTAMIDQLAKEDTTIQMYLNGYIMGIDPDTFYPLFGTDGGYNYMHYDFTEIDDLFKQGRETSDEAERKAIYEKLQQTLQDEACFYPLVSNKRILVVNKRVGGVEDAKLVPVYTFEDTSKLTLSE